MSNTPRTTSRPLSHPAFESQPKAVEGVDCVEVVGCPGLFLLPEHVGLAEYEVTLGIAQELSGSIQTLRNLPGSISWMLNRTAEKQSADNGEEEAGGGDVRRNQRGGRDSVAKPGRARMASRSPTRPGRVRIGCWGGWTGLGWRVSSRWRWRSG